MVPSKFYLLKADTKYSINHEKELRADGNRQWCESICNALQLAGTAKANEVNTYKYFELLLTEIPKHMEDSDLFFINLVANSHS